jgi:hypothetical protein
MGRERRNHENLTARFPAGTLARIEAALRGREGKADFIRAAVEEKLERRERAGKARAEEEPTDEAGSSTPAAEPDDGSPAGL